MQASVCSWKYRYPCFINFTTVLFVRLYICTISRNQFKLNYLSSISVYVYICQCESIHTVHKKHHTYIIDTNRLVNSCDEINKIICRPAQVVQ